MHSCEGSASPDGRVRMATAGIRHDLTAVLGTPGEIGLDCHGLAVHPPALARSLDPNEGVNRPISVVSDKGELLELQHRTVPFAYRGGRSFDRNDRDGCAVQQGPRVESREEIRRGQRG